MDAVHAPSGPSRSSNGPNNVVEFPSSGGDTTPAGSHPGSNIARPQGRLPRPESSPAGAVPPQNQEAEENVLGAMLLSPGAIDAVSDILDADDFYRQSHGLIYRAALRLHEAGEPVDAITLVDALEQAGDLDRAGGRVRIHELARLVPATANAAHYARIVHECATDRGLIHAGGEIARLGWERDGDAAGRVDQAGALLDEITDRRGGPDAVPLAGALRDLYRRIADRAERGDEIVGVPTGIRALDQVTMGFEPGNLVIVGARPSIGKSAFAVTVARNLIRMTQLPVAFFSLEMTREEIALRLLAQETGISSITLRGPGKQLDGIAWKRISDGIANAERFPLLVEDTAALSLLELRAVLRKVKRRHPTLGLVVVDYLQLMEAQAENRTQEVTRISKGLKAAAKDFNVPVLALSQLNRNLEQRNEKRPVLSDLRESGSIEQDADIVLFLHRDDYYNRDGTKGTAEVIVAKQRNGPLGVIPVQWQDTIGVFRDLDTVHDEPRGRMPGVF